MPATSLPKSALRWAVDPGSAPNEPLLVGSLSVPKTDEPTTLAVIADSHLTTSDVGTWKVYHRSEERLRDAIVDINQRNVAGVLIAGDLTKDGTDPEFRHAWKLLDALRPPVAAIPGNHDVPISAVDTRPKQPIARVGSENDRPLAPFVSEVGGIDLVGLDSASAAGGALNHRHAGYISVDQLSKITPVLTRIETPIVASHHNLTNRLCEINPDSPDIYQLNNAETVATALGAGGVELLVSGHAHYPTVAGTSGIHEIIVPATCSFPQGYALIHVGTDGTEIEFVPIADRAGLEEAWEFARDDDREFLLHAATTPYPLLTE